IPAAAFNLNATAITIVEEPKIQDSRRRFILQKLDSELIDGRPSRKPAEFSRRIDDDARSRLNPRSGHLKSRVRPRHGRDETTQFDRRISRDDVIENVP